MAFLTHGFVMINAIVGFILIIRRTSCRKKSSKNIAQSIIGGDSEIGVVLVKETVNADLDLLDAISKGYVMGVNQIGESFSCGNHFLPELIIAGRL